MQDATLENKSTHLYHIYQNLETLFNSSLTISAPVTVVRFCVAGSPGKPYSQSVTNYQHLGYRSPGFLTPDTCARLPGVPVTAGGDDSGEVPG